MMTGGNGRSFGHWRSIVFSVLAAFLCVLALQPLFVFSLTFMRSQTDLAPIRAHIRSAFEQGVLDDDARPRLLLHRYGHQFTECVALQISLDDEKDPLKIALTPQLIGAFIAPCAELYGIVVGTSAAQRTDYSRYWHGYRIYIWLLLERVDLVTLRFINAFLLICCLVLFYRGLRVVLGPTPTLIFFFTLLSLTDIWRVWRITPHYISVLLILFGTGLFGLLYKHWHTAMFAIVYAAIFGAIFNFLDILVNPPMAPMLLGFIFLAIEFPAPQDKSFKAYRSGLLVAGLVVGAWFCGYGLTWGTKWALAASQSSDVIQSLRDIFDQIALRTFGHEKEREITFIPLLSTLKMFIQSLISIGTLLVMIIAGAIAWHLHNHWRTFDSKYFLVLTMPIFIAVAWFELLNNHTQTHAHFAYRSESAAIAMVLATAVLAMRPQPTNGMLLANLWRHLVAKWKRRSPSEPNDRPVERQ